MTHLKWILILIPFFTIAQTTPRSVHLKGSVINAKNQTLEIVQYVAQKENQIAQAEINEDGSFKLDFTVTIPDYYVIKLSNGKAVNLIIEQQDTISVYGDANNFSDICNIIDSESSTLLNEFMTSLRAFKIVEDSLRTVLNNATDKDAKMKEVQAYFQPIASKFTMTRNQFINQHIGSPAIIGPLNAVSYDQEPDLWKKLANAVVTNMPSTYSAKSLQSSLMQIQQQEVKKERFAPGTPAPEIELPNPDGKIIKLSDLRGKVVLIDFWASWCGPCRRENPTVVQVYNDFKDKGFDIYSVSLDKTKTKWLQAIEADKLTWESHVSDLKGWSNAGSKAYGVNSIPFTVLVDQEGNIITTNLRGEQLRQELEKIFVK